jgi:glutamate/tyrosine decarboxylase-like PLP-dependent enzyme
VAKTEPSELSIHSVQERTKNEGSMANMIGLIVARNTMAGCDVRKTGVAAFHQPLRFYGSDQLHSCHQYCALIKSLTFVLLKV